VGIGTSSPSTKLTVFSGTTVENLRLISTSATTTVAFQHNAGSSYSANIGSTTLGSANVGLIFNTGLNNNTTRMVIDVNGKVGIGTSSPSNYSGAANNLVIAGSGQKGMTIATTDGSQTSIFFADSDSDAGEYAGAINYFHSDDHLEFYTASAERLRIDSSGNVGIGVTSPSSYTFGDVAINGGTSAGLTLVSGTTGIGTLAFADGTSGNAPYRGFVQYGHVTDSLFLGTSGTTAATIDSSGNVGIGTSSPGDSLHLKNNSSFQLRFDSSGANKWRLGAGWSGFYEESFIISDTNAGNRLVIDPNGKVGIGTSSPTSALDVVGDIEVSGGVYLGGTAAANKLDDYEEGTWTPALGGTWSVNPTALSGTYTKIGRLVSISLYFSGGTKATAISGYFTGLPFAQSSSGTGAVTDAGVVDKGIALCQNVDRVWLTATAFNTSTYVVATYTTTA
jgi:hypothetical protein